MGHLRGFLVFIILVSLIACSTATVTRVTVHSFDIQKKNGRVGNVVDKIVEVLISRGFDIKIVNKDIGLITTEYKKFASSGDNPPFDYYMQLKIKVNELNNGFIAISTSPIVKAQNRLNAAAFTENELTYYVGDKVEQIASMTPQVGWQHLGMTLFMNIMSDICQVFGVSTDQIIENTTKTPEKVLLIKQLIK